MTDTPELKPIKTAPKDGTEILLWSKNWGVLPVARWEAISELKDGGVWQTRELNWPHPDGGLIWPDEIGAPTHWMNKPKISKVRK